MTQVAAHHTPSDPATVAGAFVWAYKKLFGMPPISRGSWLIPLAQSAVETAHWTEMLNFNTGYVTGGATWFYSPKVTVPLQFTSYPSLGAGAMGQLHWLANHKAMSQADANNLPGFIAAIQAAGYAGNANYSAYQADMQAYMNEYASLQPSAYWEFTPGVIAAIALGIVGVSAAAAYLVSPDLFARPLREWAFENPQLEKQDSSRVQSLLFPKSDWTKEQARTWLREHGYKSRKVDETEKYYRFRQEDPDHFSVLRTKKFGNHIKAVIGR
jgi:hypothetical protein